MNCKDCMTKDCIILLRDVNKIVTLLEELKSKLQSKITNSRLNREHVALKYAKSVISPHLESTIEIREQLTILQECLQEESISCLKMEILSHFYKDHVKEFRTTYKIYRSMLI
jgi:hypothetical protein